MEIQIFRIYSIPIKNCDVLIDKERKKVYFTLNEAFDLVFLI